MKRMPSFSLFCYLSLTIPPRFSDLFELHILRSLSNVPVVSIHSSCSGNYFIAIDTSGDAWLFSRNTSSALGVKGIENAPVKLRVTSLIAAG
jgi:hypothetical protein